MKNKTGRAVVYSLLILLFLALNWGGERMVSRWNWPLWLDSVGTVLCAYLYGPLCGVIVGITYNLLYAIVYEVPWYYAAVSTVIALVVGIASRRKKLETMLDTLTTGAILASAVALTAFPINLLKSGGVSTGNQWGDAVMGFLGEAGIPEWAGLLVGDLYVELLDKLLILVVMHVIIHLFRLTMKLIRSRIHQGEEDEHHTTPRIASFIMAAMLGVTGAEVWAGQNRTKAEALSVPAGSRLAASVGKNTASERMTGSEQIDYNNYVKTVFSTSNGLPCGKANDIAMTNDGILWIGTYAGLYRYNGREFRQMNEFESVRNVNCLYVDEEGRLWIGTNDSGLSIMINEQIVNVIDQERGLPSNTVRSIIKSTDGYYYIGTAAGTQVLTLNTGLQRVGIINEVINANHLAADKNGNVAAIAKNGIIYLLRQGKVVTSRRREEGKPIFTTCSFEPDGTLLAATEGDNIHHFLIEGDAFVELGFRECDGLKNIKTLLRLENGELFICADNGIAHINSEDVCDHYHSGELSDAVHNPGIDIIHICHNFLNQKNRIEHESRYEQIYIEEFNNSIDNMLVDYQGNLWFTSSRLGLLRLARSDFKDLYSGITGAQNRVVNAVVYWNGTYYIGTDKGMDAVDHTGKKLVRNAITDLFPQNRIRCMMVDQENHLWVCTYHNGLFEITDESDRSTTESLSPEIITDQTNGAEYHVYSYNSKNGTFEDQTRVVYQLADGTVLAGGNTKLVFIRDHAVAKDDTITWDNGGISIIMTISEMNDGTILAGTDGSGLALIGDDHKVSRVLTRKDGLSSEVILRIVPDSASGGAYIVTSNGLCYMEPDKTVRSLKNFPYYNNYDIWVQGTETGLHQENDLPQEQEEEKLFILSSAGIYITNRDELLSGKENISYDLLDVRRGLNGSLTPNAWIWFNPEQQELYLPCDIGVFVLDTASVSGATQYYRMNVTGIKAGETTYRAERNATTTIPRKESRIEILPEVINYSVQDPNVGYKLEGFDTNWTIVPQNALGSIVYSNLPTGDYVFRLAVFDNQNNIVAERTYPISRSKEMYDNNWFIFYILSVPMFTVFWVTWLLLKRHERKVKAQLAEANRQVEMGKQTVRAIAKAVDAKDERTGGHSTRVALYSGKIAHKYGMDDKQCREIEWAAQLHDIGKIAIPDAILNKDSRLTDDEYAIMKSHTTKGAEILKDFTLLDHVTEGAQYHHERPDGRGYPQGLKGEEIPLYARIIGVADAFDAMTANRVYRKQMDFGYVLGELEKGRGTQFAPEFVDILLELIRTNEIDLNELYGIKKEDNGAENGKQEEEKA